MSSGAGSTELTLRVLDTEALLRVGDTAAAAAVSRLLAPFVVEDASAAPATRTVPELALTDDGRLVRALRGDEILSSAGTWAVPVGAMVTALNRQAIEDYCGFALHAGVIALDGRAIAFPADSGGGKSTLTAACIQAGFEYVSDESLCIDVNDGSVVPYPKPLGLSQWSRQQLGIDGDTLAFPPGPGEGMATPEDLGSSVAAIPLTLAHVVLPTYGSDGVSLQQEPAHVAMAALLVHSFNHFKHGERAFTLAASLASEVGAWRIEYDDPVTAAQLLRSRLT